LLVAPARNTLSGCSAWARGATNEVATKSTDAHASAPSLLPAAQRRDEERSATQGARCSLSFMKRSVLLVGLARVRVKLRKCATPLHAGVTDSKRAMVLGLATPAG
jgi:hypothetical protein